jgi:outer membrane protein assembly factor BamD (BamD/ComL family)
MIFSGMNTGTLTIRMMAASLLLCSVSAFADKKPEQTVKPMAGPRATALRVTWLYISPDKSAQKTGRVQVGREMVVAEKSGPWIRVYANTDIEEERTSDQPEFAEEATPPISGWMEARGVVVEDTPNGDLILMGGAANQEAEANDPKGPANAARSAHLLYRRLAEMFPNSPLAAEAAWRAADISWQIQKSDFASMPSAKERDPSLRQQMDEDGLKKVIKFYPHTRQADLAEYDLIDNRLCGDWQGSEKCPEKESEIFEKYAAEHPDSPRAARALYEAVYRQAALADMFGGDGSDKKQDEAKAHARELAGRLKDKFPQSDFTWRAAALVFKLDQGVPVYGIDRD